MRTRDGAVVVRGTDGIVPAIVGAGCCIIDPFVVTLAAAGSVKRVVVSAFVPVIGAVVNIGGGVSPGPLMVDVTLSVCPSCTTS